MRSCAAILTAASQHAARLRSARKCWGDGFSFATCCYEGDECWDEEDESSPVEYADGVVLYLSGEFDVGTGDYGPGCARMQTTINERTDGTPAVMYSPAAAEVLNACDTSLGVDRATSWG